MKISAILLLAIILFGGCAWILDDEDKRIDLSKYDETITYEVKSKLASEKYFNLTKVDVDTNNAAVYLNGIVETLNAKARAEQLAWQVKYVKAVVNNLQVMPSKEAPIPKGQPIMRWNNVYPQIPGLLYHRR